MILVSHGAWAKAAAEALLMLCGLSLAVEAVDTSTEDFAQYLEKLVVRTGERDGCAVIFWDALDPAVREILSVRRGNFRLYLVENFSMPMLLRYVALEGRAIEERLREAVVYGQEQCLYMNPLIEPLKKAAGRP